MRTIMTTTNLKTIKALEAFLEGNQLAAFAVLGNKTQRYDFIRKALIKFGYMSLSKKDKGIVIQYLIKMTGYSRQQLTRLIRKYTKTGKINWTPCRNNGFAKKYSNQDIALLAKTDELHDTPCGQAVKKICERAFDVFDDDKYKRLSELSISHLYNLSAIKNSDEPLQKRSLVRLLLVKEESRIPKENPVTFALIRCIKAILIKSKASIISMPLTKSRSLRSSARLKKSVNSI